MSSRRERLTPDLKDVQPYPDRDRAQRTIQRLNDARTYLLRRYGWYGDMAMRMQFVVSDRIPRAAVRVDATCFVNPDFLERLDLAELCFVITHELWHVLGRHFDRCQGRDSDVWNDATDFFINGRLLTAGMKMPTRPDFVPLYHPQFLEMSEEEIYAALIREQMPTSPQSGRESDMSGDTGALPEPTNDKCAPTADGQTSTDGLRSSADQQQPSGGEDDNAGMVDQTQTQAHAQQQSGHDGEPDQQLDGVAQHWADCDYAATDSIRRQSADGTGRHVMTSTELRGVMVAAARRHTALGRGDLPAGVDLLIPSLDEPPLTLDHLLDQYLSTLLDAGTTYRRPSRRSAGLIGIPGIPAGAGVLLPGAKERLDTIDVVLDTSGSRSMEELATDTTMIETVLARYDYPVRIICGDAAVQSAQLIQSVDEIQFRGGGGTDSGPIFQWITEHPGPNGYTRLCVYFTDLAMKFPAVPPPFDVCWVYDGPGDPPQVPFGEVIVRPPARSASHPTVSATSQPVRTARIRMR